MRSPLVVLPLLGVLGCTSPGPCEDAPGCDFDAQDEPGSVGQWSAVHDVPVFAAHAALMPSGQILIFSGDAGDDGTLPLEAALWNPQTGATKKIAFPSEIDLYCSGHSFLADGRLTVLGGGGPFTSLAQTAAFQFDPTSQTFTRAADMAMPRWYPTALTLADGRILAVSGLNDELVVLPVEVYDPEKDRWTTIAGADHLIHELYPGLHLLPSGQVFNSRAGWRQGVGEFGEVLTLDGDTGEWTELGQMAFPDRQEGSSVLLLDATRAPVGAEVIVIGGGASHLSNSSSVERIDLTDTTADPRWRRAADLTHARMNVNSVALPDGRVLVVGGQLGDKFSAESSPVLEPEIYDPAADTWTAQAPLARPRQYHSTLLLLPDARVAVAGGLDPTKSGDVARNQHTAEIFSPPYLFRGARPGIVAAPKAIKPGQRFKVQVSGSPIRDVALIRTGSVTHHTDAGQRYIRLSFQPAGTGSLDVTAPPDGNTAPPGPYMLFVVDQAGVPSVAAFVRVDAQP